MVIVDYAHTPDGLKNVLLAAREITPKTSKLICLFGCGGDRDKLKRPLMGKTVAELSDYFFVTSDNPRTEDPISIIEDIKTGINKTKGEYTIIPDRREAIKYSLKNAKKSDIIVLAGKGHEDYQEINHVKYPFDERKVIAEILDEGI